MLQPSENAAAPWMSRPDWAAGRVVSSAKGSAIFFWLIAAFWNAISFTVATGILIQHPAGPGNYRELIVLLFPAVGIGLIIWAVMWTRRWLRYGNSVFEMAMVPAAIGGVIEGSIRPRRPLRADSRVTLRLRCMRCSGSGKNRMETEIWRHEEGAQCGADGGSIAVAIRIPAGCDPTSRVRMGAGIFWWLEAAGLGADANYMARFDVPVYAVELTPEQRAETGKVAARELAQTEAYEPPRDSPITVRLSRSEGKEFYFPAGRNPGAAIAPTIVTAGIGGVAYLLAIHRGPIVFPIVCGLFFLLFLYATLNFWFRTTLVEANRDGIVVTSGILGIKSNRKIGVSDIADIKTSVGTTVGSTVYYDIKIVRKDGGETGAGGMVKGDREAEWLVAEMKKAANL